MFRYYETNKSYLLMLNFITLYCRDTRNEQKAIIYKTINKDLTILTDQPSTIHP